MYWLIFFSLIALLVLFYFYFKSWPKFVFISIKDQDGKLIEIEEDKESNYPFKILLRKIWFRRKLKDIKANPFEKRIWIGRRKIFVRVSVNPQYKAAQFKPQTRSAVRFLDHFTEIEFTFERIKKDDSIMAP